MPDEYYCAKCDIISTSNACPECGTQLEKIDAGLEDLVLSNSENEQGDRYEPSVMTDDFEFDVSDDKDLVEAV